MRELLGSRGRRRAVIAAIAVVIVGGLAASTFTPLFGADTLVVEGTARLGRDEVLALGGLGRGTNVFHLDAGAVVEALESDPRVAQAEVARELPSTIVVTIRERVPVAAAFVDGTRTLIADDGVVLPGEVTARLPTIRAEVGEPAAPERTDAARVLAALGPSLRRAVETAAIDPAGELRLEMRDLVVVAYGPMDDVEAKARSLRAVIAWAADEGVDLSMIDVSVPGAPTVRTSDGGTTSA
jgi:cell division protein FtsQ